VVAAVVASSRLIWASSRLIGASSCLRLELLRFLKSPLRLYLGRRWKLYTPLSPLEPLLRLIPASFALGYGHAESIGHKLEGKHDAGNHTSATLLLVRAK